MANRVFPYIKSVAPTVNDDTGDGYKVGDLWLDTTNDLIYEAIDVTAGAAVWMEFVGRTQTQTLTNKTLTSPTIADFTNAAHDHGDTDDGGSIVSASTTVSGAVEIATSAETDTGTDATRAVSPDGLAGSVFGKKTVFCLIADSSTTPSATGDGKVHFIIPPELNGMNLVDADAVVTTVSSSGTPTFAVRRERSGSAVDCLSTNITIDQSEKTSYTAATAPVINTSNDDMATGDIIYIDLDTIGTGAKGHGVVLSFQLP